MISIDPTILIVMGEIILALVVVIAVILARWITLKKRDKAAVIALEGRLTRNEDKRQEWYHNILTEGEEEPDSAFKEMAHGWVEKENNFYGKLIEMYMHRNSTAMSSLDKLLHDYSSSYLELVVMMRDRLGNQQANINEETRAQIERMAEEGVKIAQEMEILRGENERLSKELASAYSEIEQAMKEYSMAFRPGGMMGSNVAPAAPAPAVESQPTPSEEEMPENEAEGIAEPMVATFAPEQESGAAAESESLPVMDEMVEEPAETTIQNEPPTLGKETPAIAATVAVDESKILAALESSEDEIELPKIDVSDDVIDLADEALDKEKSKKKL
ncbi:MAG: hypothetical protein HY272_02130 [Gammaproteobacteria bacterium]|nr:hypothetical protein [Gammaproteobacteria bacterium]